MEVAYTRVASVMLWPAFVYMVIGIALMGFGLPGIVMALWRDEVEALLRGRLPLLWTALAASSLLPLALVFWFAESLVFYAAFALALALPFACAGLVCVLAFMSGANVRHVAAASTLGGMLGAILAATLSPLLGVPLLLFLSSAAGLGVFAIQSQGRARSLALAALAGVALLGFGLRDLALPGQALKWYPLFSQLPRFAPEFTRWDPVARIDVSDFGGEYRTRAGPAPFKLLTQDYTAPSFFLKLDAPGTREYLSRSVPAAGYWARPGPASALIIGIGGGPDVQTALLYGARQIDAVEINATTIELLTGRYDRWIGIGRDPRVRWIHDDGGHYLRTTARRYDHIQMSGVDTDVASISGTSRIAENYLYTRELVGTAYDRLAADGVLVFAWADYSQFFPVKERMFVTMLEVLAERGVAEPGRHLAVVGAGGTFSILLKRSPLEAAEIARLEAEMRLPFPEGPFDMMYRLLPHHPVIAPTRPEVHYVPGTSRPSFFTDALGQLARGRHWNALSPSFNLTPTTNDRPFFFIVDRLDGSMVTVRHHLEVLLVAVLAAAILLPLPLASDRSQLAHLRTDLLAVAGLGALGCGFAAAQVVFLQKAVYIIGYPALAVAMVIAALLGSMTAGNLLSARLAAAPGRVLLVASVGLCALLAAFGPLHQAVADLVDPAPLHLRVAVTALLVGLPGLFMGVPYPLSLQLLSASRPATLPWALSANAAANVVAMVATGIACWFIGFTWALVLAATAYALGAALVALATRRSLTAALSRHE